MGCEYYVNGHLEVRNTPEAKAKLEELKERLHGDYVSGDDAVEIQGSGDALHVDIAFDDYTTIHTPEGAENILEELKPFVTEPAQLYFRCYQDDYSKWYGATPQQIAEAESKAALDTISQLLGKLQPEEMAQLKSKIAA